jgi:transcriptional regulator with XRE-family HTH domain
MPKQTEVKTLGDYLREHREAEGESMAAVGRRMKARETRIAYIENDQVTWLARVSQLLKDYAKAYQVDEAQVVEWWATQHDLELPGRDRGL